MKKHDIKIIFRLYKQFCRFKTKRRKLHFKEILFLVKSTKTRFSKKFWFYFFIFKYFLDNSLKTGMNFHFT